MLRKLFATFVGILMVLALLPAEAAAFSAACEIGDTVWHDVNHNGIQDPGEPGIDNVTVELRHATTNMLLATTTTGLAGQNQHGFYVFHIPDCGERFLVVVPNAPVGCRSPR